MSDSTTGTVDVQPIVEALLDTVAAKGLAPDITTSDFVALVDEVARGVPDNHLLETAAVFWRAWSEPLRLRWAERYLAANGFFC